MHVVEHLTPDAWCFSVGSHFDGLGCSKLVCMVGKFSLIIMSIGIPFVEEYRICPGVTFRLLTILLNSWTRICCCWLDVMFQLRTSLCRTRMSVGSMINVGMILASRRRLIFSGPVITLGLSEKSLSTVKWVLLKDTGRPGVSLVSETMMFLWMLGGGGCVVVHHTRNGGTLFIN